jgi:hypothetical protein
MSEKPHIKRIAIVGADTAGWRAVAMLARALPGSGCTITVRDMLSSLAQAAADAVRTSGSCDAHFAGNGAR